MIDVNCGYCYIMVVIMEYILCVCLKLKDWIVCCEFEIVDFYSNVWKLDFNLVKDNKVVLL